jgi:hypothetical protein
MVPRSISVTVRALLDGLQRRRHRGPAAANDGDMQPAPSTCITDFWFIFEHPPPDRALITQCGDGGQRLIVAPRRCLPA